jgi:hypothetical protein
MGFILDVASYQGRVDWPVAKAGGVLGMIEKLTEGNGYVNPYWSDNYAAAGAAGIPRGAYHYADHGNPVTEANHFADVYLSVPRWELLPVLDDEGSNVTPAWHVAFRNQFRSRTGHAWFRSYSGVYLFTHTLNVDPWFDAYTSLWPAQYASALAWSHPGVELWQNTSSANVAGVVGHVDESQFENGWTPAVDMIRMGAPAPAPTPGPPPVPHPVTGKLPPNTYLRRGNRGPAVGVLQRALDTQYPAYSHLAVDNDFGPATEAVVREFQSRDHLVVDGVAGPITLRALYLI